MTEDLRKRFFGQASAPHPLELRRLFSRLDASDLDALPDLIAECLNQRAPEIVGHAVQLVARLAGRAGHSLRTRLVETVLEKLAVYPAHGASAAVSIATEVLLAGSVEWNAKDHPYSVIASTRKSEIPSIERDILERALVDEQKFAAFEPYLVFLLSNPIVGSEASAQLTVSSVAARLSTSNSPRIEEFLATRLLPSPLSPATASLAAARVLLGRKGRRMAVLAKLAGNPDRDFLLAFARTKPNAHISPAEAALELVTCAVAVMDLEMSPKEALEVFSSFVGMLDSISGSTGLAAIVLAAMVKYSSGHATDDAFSDLLQGMEACKSDAEGLGSAVEGLRTTFPDELASPSLSLLATDLVLLLRSSADAPVPNFSSDKFVDALLISHPTLAATMPASPDRLATHIYLLSSASSPAEAQSALFSLSSFASAAPSQSYPTSRAIRAALAVPDPAIKLKMLHLAAEGNGRARRWWSSEFTAWARGKVGQQEELSRHRFEREGVLEKIRSEEDGVLLCVRRALAEHPRSVTQSVFPILLGLLKMELLISPEATKMAISAVCAALRLGVADPRVAWGAVLKGYFQKNKMEDELIEVFGVCGECWDESESYTAFLSDEIIPILAPLALASSRQAQAALALFPVYMILPLLPPEISTFLPSNRSPALLTALITAEVSTMRRSLLRGSGSTGRERAEAPPSLVEGARAALATIEALAEKPVRAGAKPGYVLGALLGSTQGAVPPPGLSPLAFFQKREKLIGDAIRDLSGLLLSDQAVLGRLGVVEGFERIFAGLWGAVERFLDSQIASGGDVGGLSVKEVADRWMADLVARMKDPKSPLEAANSMMAAVGLCTSLVKTGEAGNGQAKGQTLLTLFLSGAHAASDEGNDEVDAARALAISKLAPAIMDRTDDKTWTEVVAALKNAADSETGPWARWSGAVGLGIALRSIPRNLLRPLDAALQALTAVRDTETGKGIGLACCVGALKETDPQLFSELLESALISLETFSTRKPTAKISEFQGIDGLASYVAWATPLGAPGEIRDRARTVLLKAFESVNEKKDLALHAQMAIALSHFFGNDDGSAKEHAARLASISASASPSLSSIVSIPSLLGHDILTGQPSQSAITSTSDAAAATKLLAKLSSIASTSAELRLARMSASVCGKLCRATLEEDIGPALLGGKKEPMDLSRLDKETSAIRAVFEALVKDGRDPMLFEALQRVETALPAVDWTLLLNPIWSSGDAMVRPHVLAFAGRHSVVSSSRSLLDFLVSRCEPRNWSDLSRDLQAQILGEAGFGKLLDIAGLEPLEMEASEPGASEDAPKMTIAPTKLLTLISESFEEILAQDDSTGLQFTLLSTLHSRLATHRTAPHQASGEIPVAAQLTSLLCRVFATLPPPTDLTSAQLLRMCTESIACDARVLDYFLGGDADGDPARDVVKVCVSWELNARGLAKTDFGMSTAALASAVLENEFSAMDSGEGRRARIFSFMQALSVQLAVDEAAEIKTMLAGKDARLPKRWRTVLARRSVVLKWLGRLFDTGIVVGSGTLEALSEYLWLVCGTFVEMTLGKDWWIVAEQPREESGSQAKDEECLLEFEPELAERDDGIVLAGRLGRVLSTFISTSLATDPKSMPEILSQQTACLQILRRLLRIRTIIRGLTERDETDRAVLAALGVTMGSDRTLLNSLVAAERDAWQTL